MRKGGGFKRKLYQAEDFLLLKTKPLNQFKLKGGNMRKKLFVLSILVGMMFINSCAAKKMESIPNMFKRGYILNDDNFVEGYAIGSYSSAEDVGLAMTKVQEDALDRLVTNYGFTAEGHRGLYLDLYTTRLTKDKVDDIMRRQGKIDRAYLLRAENVKVYPWHNEDKKTVYAIAIVNIHKINMDKLKEADNIAKEQMLKKSQAEQKEYEKEYKSRTSEIMNNYNAAEEKRKKALKDEGLGE